VLVCVCYDGYTGTACDHVRFLFFIYLKWFVIAKCESMNEEKVKSRKHSISYYIQRERERENFFDDDGMCFPFVSNKRRREEEMCLIHFIIHASSFVSARRNHFYCWDLPVVYIVYILSFSSIVLNIISTLTHNFSKTISL